LGFFQRVDVEFLFNDVFAYTYQIRGRLGEDIVVLVQNGQSLLLEVVLVEID
jgi:hypothetical protein